MAEFGDSTAGWCGERGELGDQQGATIPQQFATTCEGQGSTIPCLSPISNRYLSVLVLTPQAQYLFVHALWRVVVGYYGLYISLFMYFWHAPYEDSPPPIDPSYKYE